MSYNGKIILWTLLLLVLALLITWAVYDHETATADKAVREQVNKAVFTCSNQAFIRAIFRGSSVDLKLSDGRHLLLKQAISASGARYANDDKSIVFWNKGNTAFITEGDSTTYKHCVVKGEDDLVNLNMYKSDDIQFRYPRMLHKYRESVTDTSGWSYASVKKGEVMVQFKLDDSMQPQTNLSEGTFTVGKTTMPEAVKTCMEAPQAAIIQTDSVKKGGVTYARSQYADAGAGNFYQIKQYRTLHQNSCYSIEEMVHSTNIHNYPASRGISEFDSARVWKALDVPWQTFGFRR